jgi:hypothetical protein
MIDRTDALKVSRQYELLDLQRSTFYYQQKADHSKSLELMRKIDALELDFQWMGSQSTRYQLARDGLTSPFVGMASQRFLIQIGVANLLARTSLTS